MLNSEQKKRLDELEAIETLKPDEAEELAQLQALVPADPAQDEFDAGWDELDNPKSDADKAAEAAAKEAEAKAQAEAEAAAKEDETKSQSTEPTDADGDLLNNAPIDSDNEADSTKSESTPDARDAENEKLRAEIVKQNQRMRSWEGRIKAAEKRAVEAEQKLKDAEAKGQSASETSPTEDDAELGKFFKEYPDLESPIKKVAEKIATKIIEDKVGSKLETLEERQTEVLETADEQANADHMAKIEAAHPNWRTIYESGALETWIKRQQDYIQPRLYEILETGSAREVISMFDSYNRAAGKGKESTTNSVSPEKKEKAKAIEAVPASTGGPKTGDVKITKDDFDGAWDELEKKDKQK
jgi:hypothetical protein